jgi:LysR family transcriptional regulator for metE and metH
MLERSHLEILREVNRRRTLTEAAAALHLSQSALSHSIKKLEQLSSTKIWQKKGRRLELTTAGKFLFDLAQRVLPQFEHAESMIERFAEGKKGVLRIGMECHPCYQWLLKVVFPYLQQWPDVDMDIKKDFQFDGINALKNHEVDLVITPDPQNEDSLLFTPAFNYELVLVVGRRHRLAAQSYITPSDLNQETLLTFPVEEKRLDIFSSFLYPAHCKPKSHQVIEDSEIMIQMTAADRGVTPLPDWLARRYLEILPIKIIRLSPSGLHKTLYTVIRKTDLEVDYISAFTTLAENAPASSSYDQSVP